MPRAALSQSEVEAFRDTLCRSATRLFAEHGYRGVTMRRLAADLDCSPMTPYRYFENKAAIFQAVRAAAFDRFADALEASTRGQTRAAERLPSLCRAYVRFALDDPHAYRIMFELDRPERPGPDRAEYLRGWNFMRVAVADAVADGVLEGDADTLAHLFWSGVHGLVALQLAGMLGLGRGLEELVEAFIERQLGLLRPSRASEPSNESNPVSLVDA